jgi:hypothetical protein
MRALTRDPAERYPTMQELAEALTPFGPARTGTTVVEEIQRGRGRLGEILVVDGLITRSQLDAALEVQRREGRLLGQVLHEMGLVAHSDLLTALAKQQGIPSSSALRTQKDKEDRAAATVAPRPEAITPSPREPRPRRWVWPLACITLLVLTAAAVAMAHFVGKQPVPPSLPRPSSVPHG